MANSMNHEELEKLLPWYVNGTLAGEELQAVEAFVEANESARTQVEFLQQVRNEVREEQAGSPGAFGLQRLNAAIASQQADTTEASDTTNVVKLSRWRMAAAVAGLVVMLQAGLLFNTFQQEPAYVPLGVDSDAQLVQVIFQEDATEGEIRSLLQEVGASISSGPGALGIYRLELELQQQDSEVDQLLERLRAATDVVAEANLD